MRLLRPSFQIIRAHLGAYLALNGVVYGLLLLGMGAALAFPELNAAMITDQEEDGTAALVTALLGNARLFALTILAVNVLTVALALILLPSMVVPFAGIALFAHKAFTMGVVLAPMDATVAKTLIPHSLTILIELQAYVLVVLGAYLLGRAWLRPRTVGAATRREGYVHGLRQVGRLVPPAMALFVVGALYEALSLIHIVPRLVIGG